jgi:hypothetical protein
MSSSKVRNELNLVELYTANVTTVRSRQEIRIVRLAAVVLDE